MKDEKMKTIFSAALCAALAFVMYGCLAGEKISYQVNVDGKSHNSGTATVLYTNIRSDGTNDEEVQEDMKNLFDYMLKDPKFISDMKIEGKDIVKRELIKDDDRLDGRVVYHFSRLSDVENLAYEDGFYFLTLALDDSVLYTNGEVITSSKYKRILWDDSHTTLKFEIYIEPPQGTKLTPMARFYKP